MDNYPYIKEKQLYTFRSFGKQLQGTTIDPVSNTYKCKYIGFVVFRALNGYLSLNPRAVYIQIK